MYIIKINNQPIRFILTGTGNIERIPISSVSDYFADRFETKDEAYDAIQKYNNRFLEKSVYSVEELKLASIVHIKDSQYDVYIGRGSIWGNPFMMSDKTKKERDRVCDKYEDYFWINNLDKRLDDIRGKILGCHCKPKRCHGDYLVYVANLPYNEFIRLRNERTEYFSKSYTKEYSMKFN